MIDLLAPWEIVVFVMVFLVLAAGLIWGTLEIVDRWWNR